MAIRMTWAQQQPARHPTMPAMAAPVFSTMAKSAHKMPTVAGPVAKATAWMSVVAIRNASVDVMSAPRALEQTLRAFAKY